MNASSLLISADRICLMYERATKKDPTNEELLSHLFMSYVRQSLYKKQHQAAMQLYKAKPKNPYYFWAVMSLVLQAVSCDDEKTAEKVMLPLAEKMIAKLEKEGKVDQEQETQLYLMVLEMQYKFKEALDVLEGDLGKRLAEQTPFVNFVENKRLNYMQKLEMWGQVNILTKNMLKER